MFTAKQRIHTWPLHEVWMSRFPQQSSAACLQLRLSIKCLSHGTSAATGCGAGCGVDSRQLAASADA